VMDGWSVLDRLKRNARTRSIPVHVISVIDRAQRGATMGAFAYLEKPVSHDALAGAFQHMATFLDRHVRRLLLVGRDEQERQRISALFTGQDVEVTPATSAREALDALRAQPYDCVVVDMVLPDQEGPRLLEEIKSAPDLRDVPIVVYSGADLSPEQEAKLKMNAESVILKSGVQSPEQLLRDASLFLHRVHDKGAEDESENAERARAAEGLSGKKVLVIDDDLRNVFALTSVLESYDMEVVYALDGKAGIATLKENPEVDVVLLDVMMPEMDGYETMRAIRRDPGHRSLPIIAVTAKALKEDRDKCMEAGASDYLPKPVNTEKLVELLRLWTRK
jgi:CheY-like chemotaxis protein